MVNSIYLFQRALRLDDNVGLIKSDIYDLINDNNYSYILLFVCYY